MKSKSKKLAKAQKGMAVTDDKNKTVVGTGTQTRWTSDSIAKSKSKYPQYSKQIDEAVIKQNTRDKALADQEVARTNAAKKKAATTPIVTQRTGGAMYPNRYVMNKTNVFGKDKYKEISKNKFDRVSNRYAKQEGFEAIGNNKSNAQQVISGRNPKKSVSRINEVKEAELKKNFIQQSFPRRKKGGAVKKATMIYKKKK